MSATVPCYDKVFRIMINTQPRFYPPAMSHGQVLVMIAPDVIKFLVTHNSRWTIDKHNYRGKGRKCKQHTCKCCYSRHLLNMAPCEMCAAAWHLSLVSTELKASVVANAMEQPCWWREWTIEEREEKRSAKRAKVNGGHVEGGYERQGRRDGSGGASFRRQWQSTSSLNSFPPRPRPADSHQPRAPLGFPDEPRPDMPRPSTARRSMYEETASLWRQWEY